MLLFPEYSNVSVESGSDDERSDTDGETVAAVDEIDGRPHLVVADITREGTWVAVTEERAVSLDRWE